MFSLFIRKRILFIIILILLLASFLRFYHITYHDAYTDEVLLAFRAIGMIDYVTAEYQTSPWQWVPKVPWWMRLSFHDHPILFILSQKFSIDLFGENLFAMRLPSALAGIGSVLLIFLIARRLFSKKAGFAAAALLSVQSYHVWISRLGLQDGMVIFFILLILWIWMLALERNNLRLWLLWGLVFGLGVLTKYTVVIIVPIMAAYAIIYGRRVYGYKYFWYGCGVFFVVISPVWLYNLFLYNAFGHFDFQISAFLRQDVPKWAVRIGRSQVGGLSDRFRLFFKSMRQANSPVFNFVSIAAVLYSIIFLIKKRSRPLMFLLSALLAMWLWFLIIGSTYRFVVMIIPFFVLLAGSMVPRALNCGHLRTAAIFLAALFIGAETAFTYNTFLTEASYGEQNMLYAQIREEALHTGFTELESYLNQILNNKMPMFFGQPEYDFMAKAQNANLESLRKTGAEPVPLVIIYDGRLNLLSTLWTLQRRLVYYGWPVMNTKTFFFITGDEKEEYYRKQGIDKFLYITFAPNSAPLLKETLFAGADNGSQEELMKSHLEEQGIEPMVIKDKYGNNAFWVYQF